MTKQPCRRRGLILYEIMLALTMLSTFAVTATLLLRSSMRVTRQTADATERHSRLDAATEQLRGDVWGATALHVPQPNTVSIERAGQPSITWTIGDAGQLTRAANDEAGPREWAGVAAGVTFELDGVATLLLVESPDADDAAPRRVPIVSQLALARGVK